MPKYSIILPVRNAARYVPAALASVLRQPYSDYELIISNNHSQDDTAAYLATVDHPRIRKIEPSQSLCMADHFEWAVSHARGEWCMILGADDGVLPYFFEWADVLTQAASEKNLRAIMSQRAYYFWPGCEEVYGNLAASYSAHARIEIRSSMRGMLNALIGLDSYFVLPQMYTNALFRRGLLEEAREKHGRVFSTVIPDANLASIACSLERRYLFSHLPLGWIGTSPASNGLAITLSQQADARSDDTSGDYRKRSDDFFVLNRQTRIDFDARFGNPRLSNTFLLFLEALHKTAGLRTTRQNRALLSSFVLTHVLARELATARRNPVAQTNVNKIAAQWQLCWWRIRLFAVLRRFVELPFRACRRLTEWASCALGRRFVWNTLTVCTMQEASDAIQAAPAVRRMIASRRPERHAVSPDK